MARHPRAGRHRKATTAGSRWLSAFARDGSGVAGGSDEVLGVAGGAGLNLFGAVFRQLALAGTFIMLSRWLGPASVGAYALAFAFLFLLTLVALGGFQAALTRFVAVHLAGGDRGALRGTVHLGLVVPTAFAGALGTGLYLAAPWLVRHAFHDPSLLVPLRYVALTLPAMTFLQAALSATKGFRTMKAFALVGWFLEPAVRLGLTLALVGGGMGLRGAMVALLVSNGVAALLAAAALGRLMGAPTLPAAYHLAELFRFSGMSWASSLAASGLLWADTILLGIYGSSAAVGLYNVATRLMALAALGMLPITAAFGPRVAHLTQQGETHALQRSYQTAASWMLRLSLPAFVVLLVFPEDLLVLFGSGFAAAATVTAVLAAGKLVDAVTGPCDQMLLMSGRVGLTASNNLGALALNIGLNIWLIPRYGIVGAAVALAVSFALVNLARVVQTWVAMRMLPFHSATAKGLVAGTPVLFLAWVAQDAVVGLASALVAAVAVAAVYVALVAALGVTAEDRLILRAAADYVPGRRHEADRVEEDPAAPGARRSGRRPGTRSARRGR